MPMLLHVDGVKFVVRTVIGLLGAQPKTSSSIQATVFVCRIVILWRSSD